MATSAPSFRRVVGILLSVLTVGLVSGGLVLGSAGTAYAEDGYRFWNYSHLNGDTFEFAKAGPADFTPKDGDVEGWRYGTSTVSQGIFPRADLGEVDFDAVCGGTEAAADEKRVAVLVDYGTEAEADGAELPAPQAECAVVAGDANGQQVLESVVDVRSEKGLICALDGYPVEGCGAAVSDAQVATDEKPVAFQLPDAGTADDTEAAAADSDDSPVGWPLALVIFLVLGLAAVGIPLYRRNRDA